MLEKKIAHGGHPGLRWNVDNICIRTDPAGNIKADKEKSTEKIDGAIATIMALDRAIRCGNDEGGSRTAAVINLGRVTDCSVHEGEFKVEKAKKHIGRSRTLTLELVDERNALERVMLHFSHFEKTAEKLDDKRYRLIISYEQDDETEILIRVLSFGPLVRVTAPDRFIGMIQNRLKRQKKFKL